MNCRTLDRNFVLQKQLERSYKTLEREYKISKKKTQSVAEECASFTYELLKEAVDREKENLANRPKRTRAVDIFPMCSDGMTNNNTLSNKSPKQVRPLTAQGNRRSKNLNKRPSSAHPLIRNTFENKMSVTCTSNQGSKTANSGRKTAWQDNDKKPDKEQNKMPNAQIQNKNMGNITNKPECNTEDHDENSNPIMISQGVRRPKTADFYRRKQPESEQAIFWSKRVQAAIAKWDLEDRANDWEISEHDIARMQERNRMVTPPPVQRSVMSESQKKLNIFVRRFGQKYRTQMGPMSNSPSLKKGGHKNVTISKRELASIHAETSRRLKNTQVIIMKSGKLQGTVERMAEHVKDYQNHYLRKLNHM